MTAAPGWDCQAYGPQGTEIGLLCFFAERTERLCATPDECAERMTAERQRVYRRIGELAAEGDPVGELLSAEFTDPDQLLGGGDDPPDPGNRPAGGQP